jgi:hypothetical protein
MRVVGVSGRYVGFVKDFDGQQVIVARPAAADLQVPSSAWRISAENHIVLNVAADEVDRMGWAPQDNPDGGHSHRAR